MVATVSHQIYAAKSSPAYGSIADNCIAQKLHAIWQLLQYSLSDSIASQQRNFSSLHDATMLVGFN